MKKAWKQPKLIVLSKGRPEEFVLAGCKSASTGGGRNGGGNCHNFGIPGYGADCNAVTPS